MTDRRIDLNAARAARQEKRGDTPVELVIGDDIITLPPELDLDVLEPFGRVTQGDISGLTDGMRALFTGATIDKDGDPVPVDYDELKARHGLTLDDVMVIFDQGFEQYGLDVPKSQASQRS